MGADGKGNVQWNVSRLEETADLVELFIVWSWGEVGVGKRREQRQVWGGNKGRCGEEEIKAGVGKRGSRNREMGGDQCEFYVKEKRGEMTRMRDKSKDYKGAQCHTDTDH